MATFPSDEPLTISCVLNRLIDLGGVPEFTMAEPHIGTIVREVLDNDMAGQRRLVPASILRRSPPPARMTPPPRS